jgi:ketosteroid isomerase-like protein
MLALVGALDTRRFVRLIRTPAEEAMAVTAARARQLLYTAHDAWNRRDIDALIDLYVDDLTYYSNFGSADGGPFTLAGKAALRTFVMPIAQLECLSVPERFRFEDGQGHASAEFYMRHRSSGLTHSGVYRQIVSYRDDKILRLEEYHDAPALAAFMAMLSTTT